MHAVGFTEFGGPGALRILDLPEPKAGPGEAVVRVRASAVNPTDVALRSGALRPLMAGLAPPFVCGVEFAGHVHELGEGVAGLRIGQPVIGLVNARRPGGGAHAELVVVPAASLAPAPASLDLAQAATIPMNALTASMCLDALALPAGSTVLVTGGAGVLGGYTIQLAKRRGLRVVADAFDDDVALLERLGADEIVPRGGAMAQSVRRRHPRGVDGLVDAAALGDAAASAVRDGGGAAIVRASRPVTDARLRRSVISVFDRAGDSATLQALSAAAQNGSITPRLGRRLPFAAAAEGHRLVEKGGMRGRVVLVF